MKAIYKCRVCGTYTESPIHCGRPALLLMTGEQRLMLSKLMSALLRHIPHEAGLELDSHGWVDVDKLVEAIRTRWRNKELYQWVARDHVLAIALLDPKGRFQLDREMTRIRAAYGHSIRVELGYKPLKQSEAPPVLYHGTVRSRLDSILREGVKPMKRLFVHLSTTLSDAIETGRRHGNDVVVLRIGVECLARRGVRLYKASDRVYLAEEVPPECIENILEAESLDEHRLRHH